MNKIFFYACWGTTLQLMIGFSSETAEAKRYKNDIQCAENNINNCMITIILYIIF